MLIVKRTLLLYFLLIFNKIFVTFQIDTIETQIKLKSIKKNKYMPDLSKL